MTKNFCAIATVILCTFPPASLSARSEYILGGTDGNAWTTPIGEEGGVYVIIDGQIKEHGLFTVKVDLHQDVDDVELKVWVVPPTGE